MYDGAGFDFGLLFNDEIRKDVQFYFLFANFPAPAGGRQPRSWHVSAR